MTTASTTAMAPDCHNDDNKRQGLRLRVSSPKILFILHNDDDDGWGSRRVVSSPSSVFFLHNEEDKRRGSRRTCLEPLVCFFSSFYYFTNVYLGLC